MPVNIPNILTCIRIFLIPVFTLMYFLPSDWFDRNTVNYTATAIFIIASLTDWLDGYLARKWNQTSNFGAFLDPVADKLMVAVALILLVELHRLHPFFAMIIIGREITISALREWMAQMGKRDNVAVATIGKFKTATQMAAIIFLLMTQIPFTNINLLDFGEILMFIACILTVWSMFYYLKMAVKEFK